MKSIIICILVSASATANLAAQHNVSLVDDFSEGTASVSGGPLVLDSRGDPVLEFGAREAVAVLGGERSFGMGTLDFRRATSGTASMRIVDGGLEVATDFSVEQISLSYGSPGNPLNISNYDQLNGKALLIEVTDYSAGTSRALNITAHLDTLLDNGGRDLVYFSELPLSGSGDLLFPLAGIRGEVDAISIGVVGGDSGLHFKIDQIAIVPEPATRSSLFSIITVLLYVGRRSLSRC